MQLLHALGQTLQRAWRRGEPQPLADSLVGLQAWRETPLAEALLAEQNQRLGEVLDGLFGYHLLELSSLPPGTLRLETPVNHCFRLCPLAGQGAQALAEMERLPLEDESIDAAVLHHVLDYAANPHQVLREADRVLIARGSLIIIGFNPVSLQGLWRLLYRWFGRSSFWRRRTLGPGRVADWLQVLDCEPVSLQTGFFRPPVNNARVLSALSFLERLCRSLRLPCGSYYILVARKERLSMRPTRPRWASFNPVVGLIADPSPRLPQAAGSHAGGRLTQRPCARQTPANHLKKVR